MSRNKICVYTAITGNYDKLKEVEKEEGIDYICFTNNKNLKSKTWHIEYIETNEDLSNLLLARKYKILIPSMIKENYNISLWIDGAVIIKGSIHEFISQKCDIDNFSLACFKHSQRDCVYDEAAAIIKFKKDKIENVKKIIDYLKQNEYPKHCGLNETTILVRRHDSKELDDAMMLWYEFVAHYCPRDQLSFNYSIEKTGLKIKNIDGIVFNNDFFGWQMHISNHELQEVRVFYGEYQNIYHDIYEDILVKKIDKHTYSIRFKSLKDTNLLVINIGKNFGKILSVLNAEKFSKVDVFPYVKANKYKVLLYDDVFLYIYCDTLRNDNIAINIKLEEMTSEFDKIILADVLSTYHYMKIERDNMIKGISELNKYLETQIGLLNEHCNYLEGQLKIFENSILCKLYRKLFYILKKND